VLGENRAHSKSLFQTKIKKECHFRGLCGRLLSPHLTLAQVLVAWDPSTFLPPHLVMKSLSRLDTDKSGEVTRTPLTCPESKR
jgi:hypothetical protein